MSPALSGKLSGLLDSLTLLALGACLVAVCVGLAAGAWILRASFPRLAAELDATRDRQSGLRRFLMGLVNAPALLVVVVVLSRPPGLRFLAVLLLLAIVLLVLLGLATELPALGGAALRAHRREESAPPLPEEGRMDLALGGTLLALGNLLPVAGQGLALALLLRAVGTAIYWLFTRGR